MSEEGEEEKKEGEVGGRFGEQLGEYFFFFFFLFLSEQLLLIFFFSQQIRLRELSLITLSTSLLFSLPVCIHSPHPHSPTF